MSRRARAQTEECDRRRRIAFIVGSTGFVLLLVAVLVLTLSSSVAVVAGWILVVWGVGAALWPFGSSGKPERASDVRGARVREGR